MEDDDEFGDLYTDVLLPFTTPSQAQQQHEQHHQDEANAAAATKTTSFDGRRPIDLNNIDSDDEEIFYGAPNSNSAPNSNNNNNNINNNNNNNNVNSFKQQKGLASQPELKNRPEMKGSDSARVSNREVDKIEGLAGEMGSGAGGLEKSEEVKLQKGPFEGSNLIDEGHVDVVVEESEDKDDVFVEKDENLVRKNENVVMEESEQMMIPGVSAVIPGVSGGVVDGGNENFDDEYDSDSEDDLRIVLNNDNELRAMGMERMGGVEDDEDDEDGEPLVIVADNDDLGHQPMMEDQEWGEKVGAGADGERKELGDSGKVNGGVPFPPKVVYNSHPYHHPFHSQFKYVRPGVAPMPGSAPAGPGGTPGQVRPPVNVGPTAGRGRGDWRPAGRGGVPMQKGFHSGYGMPVWGSNTSGRGLEFTLPSHKTIFEVDIDSFEEKPWKLPGIDISDFFNFGLNEESWKEYCKQLEQHRLETTMQSRIRVYESGRTEQEYDPDLPPELAAASGVQHISSENAKVVKTDAGQNDLLRGLAHTRPPLPTGRPILVETNYTDRLPSIDTRQPRIRDSDAIIEIICQDSADDEKDMVKQQDDEISREDLRGSEEIKDLPEESAERVDDFSHAYNNRKKEFVGGKKQVTNPIHDNMAVGDETSPSSMCHPGSRERTPIYSARNSSVVHEERMIEGKTRDGSPNITTSESPRDRQLVDNQKEEESSESIDGKPLQSSRGSSGAVWEEDVEDKVTISDEFVQPDRSFKMEREGMAVDMATAEDDMLKDETLMPLSKKQKLNSRVGQPSPEIDGEELKAARSSENSKARSGSSKDYRKPRDGVEEEVVQGECSMYMANIKGSSGKDEVAIRTKGDDERQAYRYRTSAKGREDSYSRKGWDPSSAGHSRMKTEIPDRRRENDNDERAWQRIDEDLHGRRTRVEDTQKRDHVDEIGSRHRSNLRESERSKKDDHQLKEHLDNGFWRGNHDKDTGSKHRDREDRFKNRDEYMDNLHSKRRKDEVLLRREQAEKEENLHGYRENSSRQKRERDDTPNQRKRDDQRRLRDDDLYKSRHKEEGSFQRERGERQRDRDEWYRPKHPQEEILSKRERDEGRGGLKSMRAAEEKVWASRSRGKEEYRVPDRDYYANDVRRNSEQSKRRDAFENESFTMHKAHEDLHAWDNQNSMALLRRNQDEHSGQTSEMASLKGKFEQASSENEVRLKRQPPTKHHEEVLSDDEQPHSRRGRSKFERWASHKERDFALSTKSPSSLQIKESSASSMGSKLSDQPSKPVGDKQHPLAKDRDVPETINVDVENKHLDTVEKLKKRSERFKLRMPSEKEATMAKKIENEPLASAQNGTRPDTMIKSERPARKRRWTSN